MAEKNLPIRFFRYREGDENRTEAGGSGEEPKWVISGAQLIKKSKQLVNELNAFKDIIAEKEKKQSIVPSVCKAKLLEKATAKSRRQYVENIINTSHMKKNIIGVVDREDLIVRIDNIQEFNTITQNIIDYNRYNYGLSCLDRITAFIPTVITEKNESYKVKLLNYQNYEENLTIVQLFDNILYRNNILFKKTEYAESFTIYKIQGEQSVILDTFKQNDVFEALFSIEPMPKYTLGLDILPFQGTLPIKKPIEGQEYATLGILDNGIASIPHLEPWITDERFTPYPSERITPFHGTFTAGVALYGDDIEGKQWLGQKGIKLFDAAVYPDTTKESIDEDDLIENIREAIEFRYQNMEPFNQYN